MALNESLKTKLTLSKKERLKSRSTIQSLFTQNNNIRLYPFKLVWMIYPNQENSTLEFGVSVSKRNFKTAVMRNKIKRRVRETYRLNQKLLYNKIDNKNIKLPFMIVYIGRDLVSFEEIQKKMKQILIQLANKVCAE